MDVITKTLLKEAVRSPLHELNTRPSLFLEECELLVETNNTPILADPNSAVLNFVEQNPQSMIDAVNALDWSGFGNPTPYLNSVTAISKYNGPAGFNIPSISGDNFNGITFQGNNTPQIGRTIFPGQPGRFVSGGQWSAWEDVVSQFSMWKYDPAQAPIGNPIQRYWLNSVYVHRCRWRANKQVSGFTADAVVYNAQLVDGKWAPTTYDQNGTFGLISNRMIFRAQNQQSFSLTANTWMEMPNPSVQIPPQRNNAVVGYIWFAVHSEMPSAWSARTGVQLA